MALRTTETSAWERRTFKDRISNLWRESSQAKAIEEVFVAAASDTTLDLYNRMSCYEILARQFQYSSYPASEEERTKTLLKVAATLPHWATLAKKY